MAGLGVRRGRLPGNPGAARCSSPPASHSSRVLGVGDFSLLFRDFTRLELLLGFQTVAYSQSSVDGNRNGDRGLGGGSQHCSTLARSACGVIRCPSDVIDDLSRVAAEVVKTRGRKACSFVRALGCLLKHGSSRLAQDVRRSDNVHLQIALRCRFQHKSRTPTLSLGRPRVAQHSLGRLYGPFT